MKDKIKQLAAKYHPDIVAIRRHLHSHPELSFQEVETGKYIAQKLAEHGIRHEHGWGENGVVAYIEGNNPASKTIALRADIDALPITEANDVSYKSQNQGVMHACGHDVHSASLLGVARILHELRSEIEGTVKLIFQPAEERLPGGASILIAEGVLENPAPAHIIGQHVLPALETGKVGFRPGMFMASADELYVTVRGKGGHGAVPHDAVDPVLITSHLVVALQQIVSRNCNPIVPSVLTFGKINSTGGSTNVIPNEVKMEGTFRTMDEDWRAKAHVMMKKMAETLAESMGGSCDFHIMKGYPFLKNDEELTLRSRQHAVEYLGEENVVDLPMRMTAEDFAYYSQVIPACFYRLGTGNVARGITSPIHTDTFNVDEDSLLVGMGLMSWLAVRELEGGEGRGLRDEGFKIKKL
ncbi:MAG: amidohydrolase [Saprospiraceae bacterium]|nr:amidohydrolase [Saprospiraceae bacterium]